MTDKKIPWWMPQVGSPEEKRLINLALDNNFVNEGPLTAEFEQKISKLVGSNYAVATTSCTAGIFLALKAVGVKAGDEVIVPDITFIATANAVDLCGARPILVDINLDTLTMDPVAFEHAITNKTKAVIPVHVTGRGADMKKILEIADRTNITVIEDAAEALLSKHQGKYLGTIGKIGCFSFSPNKTITTGQGGMVVTDDPELLKKLRMLKDHGRPVRGTGGDDRHDVIGYNFKFTDLQAALGLGQLKQLPERVTRMKRNYELYAQELKGVAALKIFPSHDEEVPQWTDIVTENRDILADYLKQYGIDSRKYWFPVHRQLAYKLPDDNFPVSTSISHRSLWLPSAFTLSDDDVLVVCNQIKKFFKAIK